MAYRGANYALIEAAMDWLWGRGWTLNESDGKWVHASFKDEISDDLVHWHPNDIYALTLKIEGEIPWFSNPSGAIDSSVMI